MFDISKYKKSNVKISIRLPENINDILKLIAKKEKMSFNNVIVSCIQNSLDQLDLDAYFNGSDDSKKTDGTNQNKNKNQGKDNKNNSNSNGNDKLDNKKENESIPKLIVRLRGKHSTKYLCSYNFTITNENTESELAGSNYDDYKVLLKKSSLKVRPGELINFEFSEKPKKIRAYIWDDEITELKMTRGSIRVPNYDKKIVVGIEGTYKNGKILYAVVLDIRG